MEKPLHRKSGMESRRVPRAPIKAAIRMAVAPKMKSQVALAKGHISGELIDISALGIGMLASIYLPKGTRLHSKFPRASVTGKQEKGDIAFVGTVKNCRMMNMGTSEASPHPYRIGIEFSRIAKRHLALIDAYVKKNLAA